MFKKLTVILILISCFCLDALANNGTVISNNFFSFTMPIETNGTYNVDKFDNGIFIKEKVSDEAQLIGFAFGLKIYKNPEEYVGFDGYKKIGELTNKKGVIYDMVLVRPSDVELAEGQEVQENFDRLYKVGDSVEIKGVNGSIYVKGKGMMGKDLYGEILKKYRKAFIEKWDLKKCENENLGQVYYNHIKASPNTDLMTEIGYAYYDINSDGIEELIIGTNRNNKSYIYDIYTMVNRKPAHVTSGDDLNNLFICNDYFLCDQYLQNDTENVLSVYSIEKNSTKQVFHLALKYNSDKKAKPRWATCYDNQFRWVPITKKEYNQDFKIYTKNYKKFDFTPFSEFLDK